MSLTGESYQGEANPRTMLVEGPYGAGKTEFAIETMFTWVEAGVAPENILVLVPQRTLGQKFVNALGSARRGPSGLVQVRTVGGLAKDASEFYFPLIAKGFGFADPDLSPKFLTIETSQYIMSRFVEKAVEDGQFDAVNVAPQQIARQVIDNLGKAALMGINYHRIPELLTAAWGDRPRKRVLAYQAAGRVAHTFREYCLQHRLLDYSLQIEMFTSLHTLSEFRESFFTRFTHIIVEHIEEETPLSHRLLSDWLPYVQGGLFTYEWDSGYRIFLGANPDGAEALIKECDGILTLNQSYIMEDGLPELIDEVGYSLNRPETNPAPAETALAFTPSPYFSFFPQMLDWTANKIAELVIEQGVPPQEIAVLAPFLSDALRFSLGNKLEHYGISYVSHRPSRALRDEPAARTILTLTALAHPHWGEMPPRTDVTHALQTTITGLDPVRADLLGKVVYHPGKKEEPLSSFDRIKPEMQQRITYVTGEKYEALRNWLLAQADEPTQPPDQFLQRLFGEVLSQPGYGFHDEAEAVRVTHELIESTQKFRQSLFGDETATPDEVGKRYFAIVKQGLLAALYTGSWQDQEAEAVFMAPAYTFLMRNRTVSYQFWLDIGSTGWWERLDQPLTHPYVLSPSWVEGRVWQDADEYERQQDMLYRLMSGLIRRTRNHIYLGISDLGEQGYEQRGPMLRIFQQILRRHADQSYSDVSA